MPKYKITFVKGERFIHTVILNAFSKQEAFKKAEELFKVEEMRFKYTDLIGEMI